MKAPRRILLATDLTPASTPAFEEALRIAQERETDLILAHAYQLPNLGQPVALAGEAYDAMDRQLRQAAERKMEKLVAEARLRKIRVRSLVIFGDPYEAIAKAARRVLIGATVYDVAARWLSRSAMRTRPLCWRRNDAAAPMHRSSSTRDTK